MDSKVASRSRREPSRDISPPYHRQPEHHQQPLRNRSVLPRQRRKSESDHRSKERRISPLGSKDMDYRDKKMGDPSRAKSGDIRKDDRGYYSKGKEEDTYYPEESEKAPMKELGYTTIMTHSRFSSIDNTPDFKPRDTISIAIERNILGDEPAVISPVLKPELVSIVRRPSEGEKPLSEREEFVTREEEYEERRVIKVVAQPGGRDRGKDR